MVNDHKWVLIDTETNGISAPIFVVDFAAQKMNGWVPDGPPFQSCLNQNVDIPGEVSRLNGYTREILERDGKPARDVYADFRKYAENRPVSSYNLDFDWDRVLIPEWSRLNVTQVGSRGICMLRLAQRLLDPVPAGNCKLQTLRQFYRLPERGAHSALGDVLTVVDLIQKVLVPILSDRNLISMQDVENFTFEEWYPTRIAFGKFKGRSFRDAKVDKELAAWLNWLSESKNARNASMGLFYKTKLENIVEVEDEIITAAAVDLNSSTEKTGEVRRGIVLFHSLAIEEIKYLVTAARERLADLEVIYARECNLIAVTQSKLFNLLKDNYRKRDNLRLVVEYRRRFIDTLLSKEIDDVDSIKEDFKKAKTASDKDFDETEKLADSQKILSEDQQAELKGLFRKLVRLFHPDRHVNNPETYKAYTLLSQEITTARDSGDIEKLREIANDPEGFARKIGAGSIDLSDESELKKLKRLYEGLQVQILEMLEALDELRTDSKYELTQLSLRRPNYLEEVADRYKQEIQKECASLEVEALKLAVEIDELTGLNESSELS
jgi:DNA polymerase III epsilon subunit-like protein